MAQSSQLKLNRTLGPLVVQWIENNLCHGPGDVQGQQIELDDEQVRFILNAYAIDDKGKRIIRRAVYCRSKGRAKSEFAGMLVCAEALGPVRFNGWGANGRPEGRPVLSPFIPCVATEEQQADNVYANVIFMLNEGALSNTPGLDIGMTRTLVPGGGKIKPVSAKSSSKDGGKETFVSADETHLYITPELRNLIATFRRNLAKRKQAEPWSLETSTMYAPGEDSVAERSHLYAEQVSSGFLNDPSLLFDHKQGPSKFDFEDDDQLRLALIEAYGEAAQWMDIERLIMEARDPDTDRADFLRYFVNVPIERTQGRWIQDETWRSCQKENTIPKQANIAVGVDAAHTRDTTACVWSWRDPETGRIVQRCRVWSCIPDKPHHVFVAGGRLDNDLVREFIRDKLISQYTVKIVLGDERYFADQLHELSDQDGLLVVEMHQGQQEMQAAWDEFYGHVHEGATPTLEVDGDAVYASHVRNTVGVKGARGWKVSKAAARLPIDAVAAGAMSAFGVEHMDELVPPGSPEPMFAFV